MGKCKLPHEFAIWNCYNLSNRDGPLDDVLAPSDDFSSSRSFQQIHILHSLTIFCQVHSFYNTLTSELLPLLVDAGAD